MERNAEEKRMIETTILELANMNVFCYGGVRHQIMEEEVRRRRAHA